MTSKSTEKDDTVSVKEPNGKWKLVGLTTVPSTIAEWEDFFKKKDRKVKPSRQYLKYAFTHDEVHQMGRDLARMNSELASIQSEKKSVVSNFKAKEDGKKAEIELISNQINNGHEHRYVDCLVAFNAPNQGMKQILRRDTGEIVRTESMTPDEMQTELELKATTETAEVAPVTKEGDERID